MKKQIVCLSIVLMAILAPSGKAAAQDPITLIIKEGIKKVIQAVDLRIQRLQNRTIWLQNAQKTLENTMSQLKLNEITDWIEKQRSLYKDYFDELWKVKNTIAYYYRVKELMEQQLALVKEYKQAYSAVKADKHFTPEEILYIGQVYTGIIEQSVKNLDALHMVINSFMTQMSDAGRMELINNVADAIQQNYDDLRTFNTQNVKLSLQRAKNAQDITVVKALYGLQ
ncbi:MAG: conjugal transfer protein TraI [Bacteroidota bacterium]|nr:conjugal transfer protein TraI [Bacteroidota bacterium]